MSLVLFTRSWKYALKKRFLLIYNGHRRYMIFVTSVYSPQQAIQSIFAEIQVQLALYSWLFVTNREPIINVSMSRGSNLGRTTRASRP